MNILEYYTDGSVHKTNNKEIIGTTGYISIANNKLIDEVIYESIPDIAYLECLAINLALFDSYNKFNLYRKIIIYSDSESAISNLKKVVMYKSTHQQYPKWYYNKALTQYQILLINTADMLIYLINIYDELYIRKVKAHTIPKDQFKIQNYKYKNSITKEKASELCMYNSYIDSLVSNTNESKFISSLPFCIRN